MCPLLGCRDYFDDLPSCLHHLLACPWLTDSWYWCPFCYRPERFRADHASHNDCSTSPALGKASRLRRAVSFFKHFGRKSSTRLKQAVSCFELDEQPHLSLPELQAASIPMSRSLRDLKGQRWGYDNQWISQEPCEKGVDPDDWHDELKMKSPSGQHTNGNNTKPILDPVQLCGTPVAELPAYYRPRGSNPPEISASNVACLESTRVVYDKSAVSPLSQLSSTINVSNFCSDSVGLMPSMSSTFPTQRIAYNQSSSVVTPATAFDAEARPAVYVQGRGWKPRERDHQKLFSPKSDISDYLHPFSCFGESTKDRVLATTEASVEDLSGLVDALHAGWMQRLTAKIGESTMKAKVSQRSPFETGIRVLRQYWAGGHLPKVFEDTFALMHIALACAWMYHRHDTLEFWNTFFKDVLKWHHVLLTPEDKRLFLAVTELIWSPPGSLSVEAIYPSRSLSLPHWSQPSTPFEPDGIAPLQALLERESLPLEFSTPSSQPFLDLTDSDFHNSEVIRVCARYLDGKLSRNVVVYLLWLKPRV